MVDVNDFELHPEEIAKVDNYSEDFKNFVRMSEENILGMMAATESVIESMVKTKFYSEEDSRGETSDEAIPDDPIHHPKHYTHYKGLEVIQLTEQMNFNRGNAVKYIARAGVKDQSKEIEDLEKAKWYIQREIDRVSEDSEEGESPRRDPNTPHSIIQDMEDGLLG